MDRTDCDCAGGRGPQPGVKSDREDIREMEGLLGRTYDLIAEVAKKLAVYVRERFECSRGRDGPDYDWSR